MLRSITNTPVSQKNDLQGHICTSPQSYVYCNGSDFSQTAKKLSIPLGMMCSTRAHFANINTNASGSFSLLQSSKVPNWDKQKDQGCSINKGQLLPGSQFCCPWGSLASVLTLPFKKRSWVLLPPGKAHLFGSYSVCLFISYKYTVVASMW